MACSSPRQGRVVLVSPAGLLLRGGIAVTLNPFLPRRCAIPRPACGLWGSSVGHVLTSLQRARPLQCFSARDLASAPSAASQWASDVAAVVRNDHQWPLFPHLKQPAGCRDAGRRSCCCVCKHQVTDGNVASSLLVRTALRFMPCSVAKFAAQMRELTSRCTCCAYCTFKYALQSTCDPVAPPGAGCWLFCEIHSLGGAVHCEPQCPVLPHLKQPAGRTTAAISQRCLWVPTRWNNGASDQLARRRYCAALAGLRPQNLGPSQVRMATAGSSHHSHHPGVSNDA